MPSSRQDHRRKLEEYDRTVHGEHDFDEISAQSRQKERTNISNGYIHRPVCSAAHLVKTPLVVEQSNGQKDGFYCV